MRQLKTIVLFTALILGSTSAEICDLYIRLIDQFQDGYRGIIKVPVMANQNGWNLLLQFDKKVRTLDVPNANIQNGVKNGSRFILTNLRHNMRLLAGTNLTQEFVIHFSKHEIPRPKIQKMQLGAFVCEPEKEGKTDQNNQCVLEKAIPDCINSSRVMSEWDDGFKMELNITVARDIRAWKMALFFSVPVIALKFSNGNIIENRNNTEFLIQNKDNSARLQIGQRFKAEMTVSFFRNSNARIKGIILDPARFLCGSQDFVKKIPERYSIKGISEFQQRISHKRICEDDLRYLDRFPDGFRAVFRLPVRRNMNGWKVLFEFDANVRVFDVPDADIQGGRKSGRIFILKNKLHNAYLRKGSTLRIEFTVHYSRGMKLNIKNVRFEAYSCQAADEDKCYNLNPVGMDWLLCTAPTTAPPPQYPGCTAFFKRSNTWPDGEQGVIQIPVNENKNGWNVTVKYNKAVLSFDVTQADKIDEKNGVYFVFRNKAHTARLKSGLVFNFAITIHYRRGLNPRPKISLVKFDNKVVCMGQ